MWGAEYTSRQFYKFIYDTLGVHPVFQQIQKSRCTPRVKFFTWLVLVDRLNTKTMLSRRHINVHDDNLCVLCDTGEEETIDHLFFTCPFAVQCWSSINFNWDNQLSLEDRLTHARSTHNLPFFTEATMIAAWELWKLRNDKIFERQAASHNRWFCNFKMQCFSQSIRFKDDLRTAFCFWLDAFS